MARYFTSDLHFGHGNIIRYSGRPYACVDDMNESLIANWNDVVDPDDEVWVLGDVAMGTIDESLALVKRLHGRKVLVAGNHDRCWHGHGARAGRWVQRYRDAGFGEVLQGAVMTTVAGVDVVCSHFPYEGDSHDRDRYVEHRPVDEGAVLLHGHVHEAWQAKSRQINVGVDVWGFRPVSEPDLEPLVREAS